MVLYATCSNVSVIEWRSVLLVEEIEVLGENHRPVANHGQICYHIMLCHLYIDGTTLADVVEWSRALDIRLSDWCCNVSMV